MLLPRARGAGGLMALPSVLAEKHYRFLLSAQAVSALGDWMGTVALIAVVLELTGSSTAVGGVLVLRLMPGAVAWPLAAGAVRRWDRRRAMLVMDLVRAGMIAMVPLVQALWWVYLWAFLVEVASLVFLPARDSVIPDLIARDELPMGNGLMLASSYGTIPLGAAAFTAVAVLPLPEIGLLAHPHAVVFWLDALTFLGSFALIRRLPRTGPGVHAGDEGRIRFRTVLRIPLVRAVLPLAIAASLSLGTLFSLGIVLVRDVVGATDVEFGLLILLFGVGGVGGLALLQRRRRVGLKDVRFGLAAMGAVVIIMSGVRGVGWTLAGAAAFGGAAAYALTAGVSTLQQRISDEARGLAFTAFHVTVRVGLGLAAIAAGAAGDLLEGVRWPLVGQVATARVVLLLAGVLVVVSSAGVRFREGTPS